MSAERILRPRLGHLIIKPTLACTAKCPTCAGRRQLHRRRKKEKGLSLRDWMRVLAEARGLGVWRLTISGGEPTLYQGLPDLIRRGNRYGWRVKVNTNGSLITKEYAEDLVRAGLDVVDISLYSVDPEVHDAMRGTRDLWRKAVSAVRIFAGLRRRYPRLTVNTQTILTRRNLPEFADLLKFHHELGSSGTPVSYLEGDFESRHLPSEEEIQRFREEARPRAVDFCRRLNPSIRGAAVAVAENIFSTDVLGTSEWAQGVYRPDRRACRLPNLEALVLANGEVHPCNMVEYTHEPVVGNVHENSLPEVWYGGTFDNFRRQLHRDCSLCPMCHHVYIPLRVGSGVMAVLESFLPAKVRDRIQRKGPHMNQLHLFMWRSRVRILRTLYP